MMAVIPRKNGERWPRAVQAMEIFAGDPHAVRSEFGTIRYDGRLSGRITPEAIGLRRARRPGKGATTAAR
jgi:hypothetical protein